MKKRIHVSAIQPSKTVKYETRLLIFKILIYYFLKQGLDRPVQDFTTAALAEGLTRRYSP